MQDSTDLGLALLIAALAIVLAGCGSAASGDAEADKADSRHAALRILEGSSLQRGQLRVERSGSGERLLLKVLARDVLDLEHAYLAVPLPKGEYRIINATHEALDELSPLSLSILHDGELQFGWTMLPDGKAWSGSGRLASFELERLDGAAYSAEGRRIASKAVPAVDDLSRNARWNILSWSYLNPGDYDQNGVVTIADLTPLGQNFQASGPFDPSSAQWMVDGDGNGEINLADISVIGQNFGNSVSGYEVYASPEGAGHPETGSARLVASLGLQDSQGGPADRRSFQLTDLELQFGDRYWVMPAGSDAASGLTPAWDKSWHATEIFSLPFAGISTISIPYIGMVGGKPAMAWIAGGANVPIYFAAAADQVGSQWNDTLVVPTGFASSFASGLLDIDGKPGLIFQAAGASWYISAGDGIGGSWNQPVLIANDNMREAAHWVQDGKLHLVTQWLGDSFHYRGDSTDPSTFNLTASMPFVSSPSVIRTQSGYRMAYVLDLPQFAVFAEYDTSSGDAVYVDAFNADMAGNGLRAWSLLYYDGRPTFWLTRSGTDVLTQLRGVTEEGEAWSPQAADLPAGSKYAVSVIEAYGGLFMSLINNDLQGGYKAYFSADGSASGWEPLEDIQIELVNSGRSELMLVRGHPGVGYMYEDSDSLEYRFARFY